MSTLNSTNTEYAHIVRTPGVLGGEPRIDGRRVGVRHVVASRDVDRLSPSEIAAEFGVTLAEVYAALAYFEDHRDEFRRLDARDENLIDEWNRQHPGREPESPPRS